MITREECENKLLEKARELREIYRQYNSEDSYLSIVMIDNYITINNSYFADNYSLPVINIIICEE